jgi:hypothetical protein
MPNMTPIKGGKPATARPSLIELTEQIDSLQDMLIQMRSYNLSIWGKDEDYEYFVANYPRLMRLVEMFSKPPSVEFIADQITRLINLKPGGHMVSEMFGPLLLEEIQMIKPAFCAGAIIRAFRQLRRAPGSWVPGDVLAVLAHEQDRVEHWFEDAKQLAKHRCDDREAQRKRHEEERAARRALLSPEERERRRISLERFLAGHGMAPDQKALPPPDPNRVTLDPSLPLRGVGTRDKVPIERQHQEPAATYVPPVQDFGPSYDPRDVEEDEYDADDRYPENDGDDAH